MAICMLDDINKFIQSILPKYSAKPYVSLLSKKIDEFLTQVLRNRSFEAIKDFSHT